MARFSFLVICLMVLSSAGCTLLSHRPKIRVIGHGEIRVDYTEDLQAGLRHPVIEGTINGVKGKFLIDTGASTPVLTMKAIQSCGIPLAERTEPIGTIGDRFPTELRLIDGTVIIELGPNLRIKWSDVYVTEGFGSDIWLGIIDYRTLSAAGAVMNVKDKTLTFSLPR